MKVKKKWRQLVWLQVVLILMSMYNLICCNVDEENVESKQSGSQATGSPYKLCINLFLRVKTRIERLRGR